MVMIARDERDNIARCFESFWEHVDEVVLVDTGSTDDTIQVAKAFAKTHGDKFVQLAAAGAARGEHGRKAKLVIGEFEWCNDFSAARNYADSLASGDWLTWADLDDEIEGAEHLRAIIRVAEARGAGAVVTPYAVGRGVAGGCAAFYPRPVLVRADRNRGWSGTIDEQRRVDDGFIEVPPNLCHWVRHEDDPHRPPDRFLAERERRAEREPDCLLALAQLAWGLTNAGEHDRAISVFQRLLDLPDRLPVYLDGDVRRQLGFLLVDADRHDQALGVASHAIRRAPGTPDAYLTATAIAHYGDDHERTVRWGKRLLDIGPPKVIRGRCEWLPSSLVYTGQPRLWVATSLAELGRLDEAIEVARTGLRITHGAPAFRNLYAHLCVRTGRRPPLASMVNLSGVFRAAAVQTQAMVDLRMA